MNIETQLGKGSYGKVVQVKCGEKKCAEKRLESPDPINVLRETFVGLALPFHRNLIGFKNVQGDAKEVKILMPLAVSDLDKKRPEIQDLTIMQLVSIIAQTFCAVAALHSAKLLHLDIKPDNLLVIRWPRNKDEMPLIKLTDFGMVQAMTREQSPHPNRLGTQGYIPPDFLCRLEQSFQHFSYLNTKSDVYSAGMTMLEMLAAWLFPNQEPFPYHLNSEQDLIEKKKREGRTTDLSRDEKDDLAAQVAMDMFSFSFQDKKKRQDIIWRKYCEPLPLEPSSIVWEKENDIQKLIQLFYQNKIQNKLKMRPLQEELGYVEALLTILWPTISFDPDQRPEATQVYQQLTKFFEIPSCHVFNKTIFQDASPIPFQWIRDPTVKSHLQGVYRIFARDPDGAYHLVPLERMLQGLRLKDENDLIPATWILLAFLLPNDEKVEAHFKHQAQDSKFFSRMKTLLRKFQTAHLFEA